MSAHDEVLEAWWAEDSTADPRRDPTITVADINNLVARVRADQDAKSRADERERAAGYMVEELGTRIVRQYGRIEDGDVAENFGRGLYRAVQIAEQVRNDLVRRPHLAAIREGGA